MTTLSKTYGEIAISLIGAIAIIATALSTKGSAYENAWAYVMAGYFLLLAAWSIFANMRNNRRFTLKNSIQ